MGEEVEVGEEREVGEEEEEEVQNAKCKVRESMNAAKVGASMEVGQAGKQ